LDNVMQRTAAKRVVIIAALAALVLVLSALVRPPGANAEATAPTQTTRRATSTTTSTTAPTTSEPAFTTSVPPGSTAPNGGPLLVPGASDAPASTAADVKNKDRTGTIVALVITGLLVVALLLGLLTYWFWRNTRPVKVAVDESPGELADAKVNDG
jgi:hypothetical protein